MAKAADFDHPLTFLIVMTFLIAVMMYVIGWGFTALGLEGPAQLMRGYGA